MSVWDRFNTPGLRPRHTLGLYLSRRKLWSRAFLPSVKDREQLRGRRPFWNCFGEATIPASQWTELRQVVQSDFIVTAVTISNTVGGTSANPGSRVQVRDMSPMPGRKPKYFSITGVNDSNFGGSARDTRFLRKPYRVHAGHTLIVRIQNLQASPNNVQVVLEGVFDE